MGFLPEDFSPIGRETHGEPDLDTLGVYLDGAPL